MTMTREELIGYCRYYKGEEESPFERFSTKDRFWGMEKNYVFSRAKDGTAVGTEGWENEVEFYIKRNPDKKNIFTSKDVSIHTKGIAMYIYLMFSKWCPPDGDLILEY